MSNFLKKIGIVILKLLGQRATKMVILDMLQEMTKSTENELDDRIIQIVRLAMENQKDMEHLESLLNSWKSISSTSSQNES